MTVRSAAACKDVGVSYSVLLQGGPRPAGLRALDSQLARENRLPHGRLHWAQPTSQAYVRMVFKQFTN